MEKITNKETKPVKEISEELIKDFMELVERSPKTYKESVMALLRKYKLSKKRYSDKKINKLLEKVKEMRKIRNTYLTQTSRKLAQIQEHLAKFL